MSVTVNPMRQWVRTFQGLLIKKRAEYRYYRLDYIVGVLIKFIFFVALLLSVGADDSRRLLVGISAFVLWYFSAHVLAKLGNAFIEEAVLGTLPQLLMTRTGLTRLAVVGGFAEVAVSTVWVSAFLVLVAAARLVPLVKMAALLSAPITVGFTVAGLLCLSGVIGIGLALFGLSVAWKRVGSFTEVLIFYMLFFSGFFIPLERLPATVRLSGYVSPLYWAVRAMTNLLEGLSPVIDYMVMALVAVGWNAVGLVLTGYLLRRAKARGTLTHY